MTRLTAPQDAPGVGPEGDGLGDLLARYGCGPVQFTGTDDALYERQLVFDHVVDPKDAGPREQFEAVAAAIRDVLAQRWVRTQQEYDRANPKQVYYLSMEFLIGRSLANNIINLMLVARWSTPPPASKGLRLAELVEQEPDAGLGNGGLGRLAACFIDSLATLQIPADRLRPALRVRHLPPGDRDGYQVEQPDNWLRRPDPWEVARPSETVDVPLDCPVRAAGRRDRGRVRGQPIAPARRALRPAGGRLRRADDQHPAPLGGRDARRLRLRRVQRRRLLRRRSATGSLAETRHAASSIPTTRRPAAGRCGSSRNTSSSPARWPTSSPGSAAAATTGRRCRTRSPSSSTTPTRRWPWPS